jgi:uncharacterized protein YlxP (DUF503 family)
MPETLRFDDLGPYLLLKNGNYLYKIPFRGGWAVLKVYYDSRGWFARLRKSFGNVVVQGQTSYLPKARRRVELECIDLWRRHGFRVFEVYGDVRVEAPSCVEEGYTLFEYVDAPKLVEFLRDSGRSLDERAAVYRRFLAEWGRRHALAVAEREPRLVHENGDIKHVMILGDRFLWFDFEMVYRSAARVEEHVAHEIIQYLWTVGRMLPAEVAKRMLDETAAHYPDPALLRRACGYWLRHPRVVRRILRWLDRTFKPRQRRPSSKYNVARHLEALLAARPTT